MIKIASSSQLLAVGREDAIFLSITAGAVLYFLGQNLFSFSKHEKSHVRDLHLIPQRTLPPPGTGSKASSPSRNICDAISPSVVSPTILFNPQLLPLFGIVLVCNKRLN